MLRHYPWSFRRVSVCCTRFQGYTSGIWSRADYFIAEFVQLIAPTEGSCFVTNKPLERSLSSFNLVLGLTAWRNWESGTSHRIQRSLRQNNEGDWWTDSEENTIVPRPSTLGPQWNDSYHECSLSQCLSRVRMSWLKLLAIYIGHTK